MKSYLSAQQGQTPVKIINNLPQPSPLPEEREEDVGMLLNEKNEKSAFQIWP